MKGSNRKQIKFLVSFVSVLLIFLNTSVSMPVYAEPAPVYDADSAQQIDEAQDEARDLPPPPPPGQEGAYLLNNQPIGSPPEPARPLSVEQRVKRMEQRLDNVQSSDTGARVDSLQGQIQTLRGQVEQLTHLLEQAQNQQKSMYVDLDKRLAQQTTTIKRMLTIATDPGVPASAPAHATTEASTKKTIVAKALPVAAPSPHDEAPAQTASQPNVAEEQQIYQSAYNFIKAKQYADAVNTLQGMLKKYPSGQFASNAHYWLGELFVLMGKSDQAISEFTSVVTNFPDSPRVSDALFKVGHIYAAQLKWNEAKLTFNKVINRYPGTASARLASEQLKQIKQSGH